MSISSQVGEFIERDPVLQKDISRGLINSSALAKYIIKEKNLEVNPNSVITAVRRKLQNNHFSSKAAKRKLCFERSEISSKNKMKVVVLHKTRQTMSLLSDFFTLVNEGGLIRMVNSSEAFEILIDEKNIGKVTQVFSDDMVKKIKQNVGAICINLERTNGVDAENTPGISATILNELAIHNVNVLGCYSCMTELLIIIEEKDLLKAHETLLKLCE